MKVHITPNPETINDDNGIGRIVHAQFQMLPDYGIELVRNVENADIVACHVEQGNLPTIDVLHCHGLYWTGDVSSGEYHNWHHTANAKIVQSVRKAFTVTVPSQWVAEPFKRDMRLSPTIIGHGIHVDEWKPAKKHEDYILWNKNRAGDVCDPTPAYELALRGQSVVSTFLPSNTSAPASMRVIGVLPHARMKELIQRANVYLATTQETFGIGTLEAMACGVPILGYRHGGTADLVEHKITGYLVDPGDVDGLLAGVEWLRKNRNAVSLAAREFASRFDWSLIMQQYADTYRQTYEKKRQYVYDDSVTVVITNYNYGRYVTEAIQSVLAQTKPPKELIIVDDGSTDNSKQVLGVYENNQAGTLAINTQVTDNEPIPHRPKTDVQVVYQKNAGVAYARNKGVSLASGRYILCLDADDKLDPRFLETLVPTIHRKRDLGIVYAGLAIINAHNRLQRCQWPIAFDWDVQSKGGIPPSNAIPSAALYRREMWERSGGYKQEYAPGEDCEFWVRGLSVGYAAEHVTDEPLYLYRWHTQGASRTRPYVPIDSWHPWMKDKQYPIGAPAKEAPIVRSYSQPLVSVIIPVGPGHKQFLSTALDSLLGQTFRNWEAIVIDDTDDENESIASDMHFRTVYPFIKLYKTQGKQGAGHARNLGIQHARAPFCLYLDADDYLLPDALKSMLRQYVKINSGKQSTRANYIYTDWLRMESNGKLTEHATPEYDQASWLKKGQHAVTVLIETEIAKQFPFDEHMTGWEDWDYFIKLAISGACGNRLPEQHLVYRMHSGQRRERSLDQKNSLLDELKARYDEYMKGTKKMAGCGSCGKSMGPLQQIKKELNDQVASQPHPLLSRLNTASQSNVQVISSAPTVIEPETVRMQYTGKRDAPVLYKANGRNYRGARDPQYQYINAHKDDVDALQKSGAWRIVIRSVQDIISFPATPPEQPKTLTVASVPSIVDPEDGVMAALEQRADTIDSVAAIAVDAETEVTSVLAKPGFEEPFATPAKPATTKPAPPVKRNTKATKK